jgi:transcriptional regulator with XRE-family HTH domain
MNIGMLIKQLRDQNKWSQDQLAEILKTTQSKISKIETMREPKSNLISLLIQLSDLSGMTLDEIIRGNFNSDNVLLGHLKTKAEKLSEYQLKKLIEFIDSIS